MNFISTKSEIIQYFLLLFSWNDWSICFRVDLPVVTEDKNLFSTRLLALCYYYSHKSESYSRNIREVWVFIVPSYAAFLLGNPLPGTISQWRGTGVFGRESKIVYIASQLESGDKRDAFVVHTRRWLWKESACCQLLGMSSLTYFPTLKLEAIFSSETSSSLRTALRYNLEYRSIHSHHRENVKKKIYIVFTN
jgi:hypothetical protein